MWQTGCAERETYDERDGVDVVDDIVGNVVELHDGGLRGQVTGHLVVGEPVDGVEQEATQSRKAPPSQLEISSNAWLSTANSTLTPCKQTGLA